MEPAGPGLRRPGPQRPGPYADPYGTEQYEVGDDENEPYQNEPAGPRPHDSHRYENDFDWPGEDDNPYENDSVPGDPYSGRFVDGSLESEESPTLTAPGRHHDNEREDAISRLLYTAPRPRSRAPGRWNSIAEAAPAAVALLAMAFRRLHAPARPRGVPRGRRAQMVSATLAAVALLTGALTAWTALGHHHAGAPGARPPGRRAMATRPARPGSSRPARPAPSATIPPHGGPFVVAMASGVALEPGASRVDAFLVKYFTAINDHDYRRYRRLLLPGLRARESAEDFAQGYGTTSDSGASLLGIAAAGPSVAATVAFTSRQSVAPQAGVAGCTFWDITLYLREHSGRLRLGYPPPNYVASHRPCG